MHQDSSPFVDDWQDQASANRYRYHVAKDYDRYNQLRETAQNAHIEYGKWLIASTLAIHGGAIYAVAGIFDKVGKSPFLAPAITWFVVGIGFTMIAGIMAWLNFQISEHTYWKLTEPSTLYRTDSLTDALDEVYNKKTDPIGATLYFAVAAGCLSIWCFAGGCWNLVKAISG